jgi:hypothetical protein
VIAKKRLEAMGVRFRLAVDVDLPDSLPAGASVLLDALKTERDAVIRDLAARLIATERGFYELPSDVPIPNAWEIQRLCQQIWEETDKGGDANMKMIRNTAMQVYLYAQNSPDARRMRGIYDGIYQTKPQGAVS